MTLLINRLKIRRKLEADLGGNKEDANDRKGTKPGPGSEAELKLVTKVAVGTKNPGPDHVDPKKTENAKDEVTLDGDKLDSNKKKGLQKLATRKKGVSPVKVDPKNKTEGIQGVEGGTLSTADEVPGNIVGKRKGGPGPAQSNGAPADANKGDPGEILPTPEVPVRGKTEASHGGNLGRLNNRKKKKKNNDDENDEKKNGESDHEESVETQTERASRSERMKLKRRRAKLARLPLTPERRKRSKAAKKARRTNRAAFSRAAKKAARTRKLFKASADLLDAPELIREKKISFEHFSSMTEGMQDLMIVLSEQDWSHEEKAEFFIDYLTPMFSVIEDMVESALVSLTEEIEEIAGLEQFSKMLDVLFDEEATEEMDEIFQVAAFKKKKKPAQKSPTEEPEETTEEPEETTVSDVFQVAAFRKAVSEKSAKGKGEGKTPEEEVPPEMIQSESPPQPEEEPSAAEDTDSGDLGNEFEKAG